MELELIKNYLEECIDKEQDINPFDDVNKNSYRFFRFENHQKILPVIQDKTIINALQKSDIPRYGFGESIAIKKINDQFIIIYHYCKFACSKTIYIYTGENNELLIYHIKE